MTMPEQTGGTGPAPTTQALERLLSSFADRLAANGSPHPMVGARLACQRGILGRSQADWAAELGIDPSTLAAAERGLLSPHALPPALVHLDVPASDGVVTAQPYRTLAMEHDHISQNPQPSNPDDLVHVQIVLDRSGSMGPIQEATRDAVNGFFAQQRAQTGRLRLSLADFDSQEPFRVVLDAVPVAEVIDLGPGDFQPRGGTPLLDAIGRAVERCDARCAVDADEDQILAIVTDGYENASTDYSGDTIKQLLASRQAMGWSVLYLGANQDSFSVGEALAMSQGNVDNFVASDEGIGGAFSKLSSAVSSQRSRSKEQRLLYKDSLLDEGDGEF